MLQLIGFPDRSIERTSIIESRSDDPTVTAHRSRNGEGLIVRRDALPIEDQHLIAFLVRWLPYGGASKEDLFIRFGMSPADLSRHAQRLLCSAGGRRLSSAARQALHMANPDEHVVVGESPPSETLSRVPSSRADAAIVAKVDGGGNDWPQNARCLGMPTAFFFADGAPPAERGRSDEEAKSVCKPCPVRRACLVHALQRPETYGVWGAATAAERRHMLVRRSR